MLEEDNRKKADEEVGAERERAVEAFMSSKVMEHIKIAFTQEAFLKGFEICMRRIMKKFPNMDLYFLMEKLSD
ncbi:hypothetical protein COCNU_scaffold001065G000010 [Cocos nucifera]|nr:hypothetical protein [Cocos nucifera]